MLRYKDALPKTWDKAIRVTFSYTSNKLRIVGIEKLAKVLPQSYPLEYDNESGFWYEVRDENEHKLYRRLMDNPFDTYHEVFSNDPAHATISRHKINNTGSGTFSILIPDIDGAKHIVFFSSPLDEVSIKPAKEIARFNIFDIEGAEKLVDSR